MNIITAEQGTPEWDMARLGVPTASCFGMIMKKDLSPSKSRKRYLDRLVEEARTGRPYEGYSNRRMDEGLRNEMKSIATYEFQTGNIVDRVGFCLHDSGLFGASPDGLIGEYGGFETKDAEPHIQEQRILKPHTFESQHHRQVLGNLLVTGRQWWDLVSHCDGYEQVVVRFERDDEEMELMLFALIDFCNDLEKAVDEIMRF